MLTLITNRHICGEEVFVKRVTEALNAGVAQVILREKDLTSDALFKYAKQLILAKEEWQRLIIHSDVSVACAVNADAIHFTLNDFLSHSKDQIKLLTETYGLHVGVSIHSKHEALLVQNRGASYVLASHVFETDCKAGQPGRGLDFIKQICQSVQIPVIALGGINVSNVSSVLDLDVGGVALMSELMGATNVTHKCGQLLNEINKQK